MKFQGMKHFMDLVMTKYQYNKNETWEMIARRMANATNPKYYPYFLKKIIVPQGGILFGLGRPGVHTWESDDPVYEGWEKTSVSLSNCVVQTIREDSMDGIMEAGARQAKCYQNRMGVGCDLSILRPRGDQVHNAAKSSSGAASFMDYFSTVCGVVGQEGRRGALMLTIDINHPDIEEFIEMKLNRGLVTNANISIKIYDDFMKAVETDSDYPLEWGGKIYRVVKARTLWDKIIKCAYNSAEPGVLFWDRVLERPHGFYPGSKPVTTNPCSEIPLPDDDVCLLTSLYLPAFVTDPYTPQAKFNFAQFRTAVALSIEFIDEVKDIDIQLAPYEEIAKQGFDWRRVGVGTHGLSDTFWRMGLTYGDEECLEFVEELYKNLMQQSYRTSIALAEEKGAFPEYHHVNEEDCDWLTDRLPEDLMQDMLTYGRRNLQLNTIAPTGSISVLSSNCSSGIEPPFDLSYDRFCMGEILKDIPHGEWVFFNKVTGENKPRKHMLTSAQIPVENRLKVQAVATNWLDHSCSSTINFLKGTTEKDVEDVYLQAYKLGCEGVTVYVDGAREGIVSLQGEKRERPQALPGTTYKFGEDDWVKYITVTKDSRGMPMEVFVSNLSDMYSLISQEDTKKVIDNLYELAAKKNLLDKFNNFSMTLSPTKQLVITTTILLRCSINISEILSCFDVCYAGSLAFYVKVAIKSNIPDNMKELGASSVEPVLTADPMCPKGNCG